MVSFHSVKMSLKYGCLVLGTFAILQSVLVVMHEFTHSSVAWLLGYMDTPWGIRWGNPLTLRGWDEGVDYAALFASGHGDAAAIIGVSPLVLHAAIVTLGLRWMRRGIPRGKWGFHWIFWFVVANFMELISYIVMGSFLPFGDMGNFNRGTGLSPWVLFLAGSAVILQGLRILFGEVVPQLDRRFAEGDRLMEWSILLWTGAMLFLWGSGLRLAVLLYPDPQWLFGLLGVGAFGVALVRCRPSPREPE